MPFLGVRRLSLKAFGIKLYALRSQEYNRQLESTVRMQSLKQLRQKQALPSHPENERQPFHCTGRARSARR
jgi:hypothetical protein